jgi:hypothetical protein
MSELPLTGQSGSSRCPDCSTELTPIRRRGKRFMWCWKCQRALRLYEVRAAKRIARSGRTLVSAPPSEEPDDPYGWVEFFNGIEARRLTVGVRYGDDDPGTDIVLDPNGVLLRHPYDVVRTESTDEERAAVGWTW